tara:strand:- start:24088 stop:25509 length:1422 start_codon:yes stop_codon:yes gene_type:complete
MVFSDPAFIFWFLPFALILGLSCIRTALFPWVVFAVSLLFYYWTSGSYTLLLVSSIALNFCGGLIIHRFQNKLLFGTLIFLNLALIAYYKYAGFIVSDIVPSADPEVVAFFKSIVLPIGISFFTFQGISYLIDVRRRQIEPERNFILFGAYLSFFPQLIAGPIVRFKDVQADFHAPNLSVDMFAAGASRFMVGLAKKLLVADTMARVADAAFAMPAGDISFAGAWLGAIAYTIQIYFDFSGYSDMAIGIGMMFGIRFFENFNHPYASSTVTEFWRRWHMSLSSWFRDYLYIPLGGNRRGISRTFFNFLIVFCATGLWHGAAWVFVLWGLWHGGFLILERIVLGDRAPAMGSPALRFIYLFPVVIFGWVLFRAPDIGSFLSYSQSMLTPLSEESFRLPLSMLLVVSPIEIVVLALAGASIVLQGKIQPLGVVFGNPDAGQLIAAIRVGFMICAAIATAMFSLSSEFSPFLYFRF